MIDTRTVPYAALLLRLSLGILFLAHLGLKLFVFTPAGTAQFFGSLGLPPALAYVVLVWECVGALALILGVWPRIAALMLIPDLLGAIVTVHGPAGFFFDNAHGGWEISGSLDRRTGHVGTHRRWSVCAQADPSPDIDRQLGNRPLEPSDRQR